MGIMRIAYKYLKVYPLLSICALFSIIMMSLFDGISFGMLVPLIQSMTSENVNMLSIFPFLKRLNIFSYSMSQAGAISFIFILLLIILSTKNTFTYLSDTFIAKLRFGIIKDLRVKLMNNLIKYDLQYFNKTNTGYIIGNINSETQRMGDFMLAILSFIALGGRVAAYLAILFLISWKASIVVFLLVAAVLFFIALIMKEVKTLGEYVSQSIANYNYKLTEILNGIRIIKSCCTDEIEKNSFDSAVEKNRYFQYKSSKTINLIVPLAEVMISVILVALFLVLINAIKIDITKTFPFIATYLVVLAKSLTQLNGMNRFYSAAINNLAAFWNYEDICNPSGKMTINDGSKPFYGLYDSIEFKNVNFSYEEGKPVLENVCIKIPKGKMIALVGKSGAGKSTIVNLILRFYDIDSGEILVDGINLKTLELKTWKRKIGFISQDIFLFNTSAKNNIAYGCNNVSEEKVTEAAISADAHSFIMQLSNKYETILGERGAKLSGGQKQRISIAREIIRNPEILILDEATSSLDTETEQLINDAICKLTKNRTVIAIAHRLSTIMHADNIVVLDKGRIVEMGTHTDLLEKNGYYKRLYNMQFKF